MWHVGGVSFSPWKVAQPAEPLRKSFVNSDCQTPTPFRRSSAGKRSAGSCRFLSAAVLALGLLAGLTTNGATWYADNAATGSGNGTSWANAWTSFSSIVWGSSGVKAGDTLYISGGSSSKTYSQSLSVGASGTSTSPIRIGLDSANPSHNGLVIFSGVGITIQSYVILDGNVNGAGHITVNDLAADAISAASSTSAEIRYVNSTNCQSFANVGNAVNASVHNCSISGSYGTRTIYALGSGTWDRIQVYSNYIGRVMNTSSGLGPDGFWAGNGVSIWANTMRVDWTSNGTSTEHPDDVQVNGDYIKIYRNDFINVGDSIVDVGGYSGRTGVHVYNNVFRITIDIDPYPEYFRFYNGTPAYVNDIKIVNNTFIDQNTPSGEFTVGFRHYNGNPTATGIEIKNNVFVNCASLLVESSTNFTSSSFAFDGNIYESTFGISIFGTSYTPSGWIAASEPHGKVGRPTFVSYTAKAENNDLHLAAADTVARNTGVNMSSLFTTDKDGNPRPATGSWDAGAYQYSSGSGGAPNLPPVVSAGANATITLPVNSVVLSGSASDPEGSPLTLSWTEVNGPGTATFSAPSSAVTTVTVPLAGSYTFRLSANDGTNTAYADVAVTVNAAASSGGSIIQAESGVLTAPFVVTGGYISQSVLSGVTDGGQALYNFTLTNSGSYIIQALVNASSLSGNSFYLNIDAQPTDPTMEWDINPITSGFEQRLVSWRGNGTSDADQFVPKIFTLSSGNHQLILRGREPDTQLDSFAIIKLPAAPLNFHVLTNSP
jgi:hypothetical protein